MNSVKVIQYAQPPTEADLRALQDLGCEIVHVSTLAPEVTVVLPEDKPGEIRVFTQMLLASGRVKTVEDDFPVAIVLREAAPLVRIQDLWDQGLPPKVLGITQHVPAQGQEIRVAVLDTGIDPFFPGFAGRLGLYKDYVGEGAAPDKHGHGTHVSGIIGQTDAADPGYVGMAPGVVINMYKVLDASGSGSATGIAQALEDAFNDGADVISLSLGGAGGSAEPDFLQRRADLVGARIPVVVAAGNSGPKGTQPFRETPARAANVITVGASDDNDKVASFTSRGVTDDRRIKPNVYAPGVGIAAARAAGTAMGTPLSQWTTVASGTSMATPCVAGIVAALLSHDPTLKGKPQQIKAMLMVRGIDIFAEGRRVSGVGLVAAPYPDSSLGVDRPAEGPVPEPEPPPSPCEELLMAALDEQNAVKLRLRLRRLLASFRTALR